MTVNISFSGVIRIIFGIAVITAGLINTFWGNDPWFGIFLLMLSLGYLLPVETYFTRITGISLHPFIPPLARILVGIFIVWSALGVGELFDKIGMMMADLTSFGI